jgi:hypothetical protein
MKKYYYDLHIHSALSPCGDNESTPASVAGMAKVNGLDIVALTDHNTAKNCPAFFEAAKRHGIIAVAGMELTTSEDIHAVCLFENLGDAMRFGEEIEKHRILVENRKDIFGNQIIMDGEDNVIGEEKYLLSNATDISIEGAPELVKSFGGVCFPAHIDRDSNGIISVLGTFPKTPDFSAFELHFKENVEKYVTKYGLSDKTVIVSSDSHSLSEIRDRENYFLLEDEPYSSDYVRKQLFLKLR